MSDLLPVVLYFLAVAYLFMLPILLLCALVIAALIIRPLRRAERQTQR